MARDLIQMFDKTEVFDIKMQIIQIACPMLPVEDDISSILAFYNTKAFKSKHQLYILAAIAKWIPSTGLQEEKEMLLEKNNN